MLKPTRRIGRTDDGASVCQDCKHANFPPECLISQPPSSSLLRLTEFVQFGLLDKARLTFLTALMNGGDF